tara:strand:- start:432 stop:665 length:234 start_codon:yes stop_codon:yes gene_type:complete
MLIKNGTIFNTPTTKNNKNIKGVTIIKNGTIFSKLGFKPKPVVITGFGQKILSIASSSVNKIIGVARTSIEKVIGAN